MSSPVHATTTSTEECASPFHIKSPPNLKRRLNTNVCDLLLSDTNNTTTTDTSSSSSNSSSTSSFIPYHLAQDINDAVILKLKPLVENITLCHKLQFSQEVINTVLDVIARTFFGDEPVDRDYINFNIPTNTVPYQPGQIESLSKTRIAKTGRSVRILNIVNILLALRALPMPETKEDCENLVFRMDLCRFFADIDVNQTSFLACLSYHHGIGIFDILEIYINQSIDDGLAVEAEKMKLQSIGTFNKTALNEVLVDLYVFKQEYIERIMHETKSVVIDKVQVLSKSESSPASLSQDSVESAHSAHKRQKITTDESSQEDNSDADRVLNGVLTQVTPEASQADDVPRKSSCE